MKRILSVSLLLCLGVIIYSCSKTEDFSGFNQETIEIEDEEIVSALVVQSRALRNQVIDLTVVDDNGDQVSEGVTYYVDDAAITGAAFSSASEGTFEVYAKYEVNGTEVTTDTESFEVIIPKRKVVLEDYTGAWCGYCPRISAAIENCHDLTEHIAVVAIHNDDEMALPFEEDLRDTFEVFGFPSGRINRTQNWSNPHPVGPVTELAGLDTNSAIAIRSQINGNTLAAEVRVVSEDNLEDMKLVLYLVEDGILSDQTNYFNQDETSPYFDQGNPIIDFYNHDVLRMSLSGILGDEITSTPALEEYTKNYSVNLDPSFDQEKLKLVAMLVQADNTAVNAQFSDVDATKDFE